MTPLAWVAFLVAAGIGASSRYLAGMWAQERLGGALPWGTFVVNVTGCLLLGMLTGLGLDHGLDGTAQTIVGTGGFGALTTFSTFTYEAVRLAEDGAYAEAGLTVGAGWVVGLAAAWVGLALT